MPYCCTLLDQSMMAFSLQVEPAPDTGTYPAARAGPAVPARLARTADNANARAVILWMIGTPIRLLRLTRLARLTEGSRSVRYGRGCGQGRGWKHWRGRAVGDRSGGRDRVHR